ncbi:hypothetical protein BV898_03641 [Hypsibius exemplaris]|uniref:Uncharacterized protein n=1 Tax=Hypsibius exemplaris TaxID=2072580 RepID=A0A1W0X4U2_HYPEX|nr:hypothetical protein BV898_03641 [Hypsibius exemplaris]
MDNLRQDNMRLQRLVSVKRRSLSSERKSPHDGGARSTPSESGIGDDESPTFDARRIAVRVVTVQNDLHRIRVGRSLNRVGQDQSLNAVGTVRQSGETPLQGSRDSALDVLVFQKLDPKTGSEPAHPRSVTEHKRRDRVRTSGSGKSFLARKIAQHLVLDVTISFLFIIHIFCVGFCFANNPSPSGFLSRYLRPEIIEHENVKSVCCDSALTNVIEWIRSVAPRERLPGEAQLGGLDLGPLRFLDCPMKVRKSQEVVHRSVELTPGALHLDAVKEGYRCTRRTRCWEEPARMDQETYLAPQSPAGEDPGDSLLSSDPAE